jgi:phage shock protein C
MFCTKCGSELRDQDRFCWSCGVGTARSAVPPRQPEARLSRPMSESKIAGVCAGFARYFGVDVTLIRVLWVVLTVFPMPFFGLVSYIVAWVVMPKDPVTALVRVSATNSPVV